jgi:hypothetical protein
MTETKTAYAKWKCGEITQTEYHNELARSKGFKDREDELKSKVKNNGFANRTEWLDSLAQARGFKDHNALRDSIAITKGYISHLDYVKHTTRKRNILMGKAESMKDNKECSLWLGVGIAEKVLSKVFKDVKRMSCNHPGYDFICGKGFKIDVKSSCLSKINKWRFAIRNNIIADYFLLLAFDNRTDLNPMHIWLIKGTDTVKNKRLCDTIDGITLTNTEYYLKDYLPYELKDKLEDTISCCNKIKDST